MLRTTRTRLTMRRVARLAAPALVVPLALGLSSCGDDAETSEPADSSESAAPESDSPSPAEDESPSEDQGDGSGANAGTVEITVEGGTFEPTGARVDGTVGEELVLEITADAPGELHVHSTPEQVVAFGAGDTMASIPIQQPGVIEVEDHESGAVILQIEAR